MDPSVRKRLEVLEALAAQISGGFGFQIADGVVLNNGVATVGGIGGTVTVSAATRAFVTSSAVITGSANVGTFAHLVASNIVGGPGVGQITINLLGDDGATDVDADGTIHVLLVN